MKKFLSLLLALTMVMSLVVVPARAASTDRATGSFSISGPSTATEGDSVNFSITSAKISYGGNEYNAQVSNYSWSGLTGDGITANAATYSGVAGTSNLTISCSATLTATATIDGTETTLTVESATDNHTVTVTTKQVAFENKLKTAKITFNGRQFAIGDDFKATVKYFKSEESLLSDTSKFGCTLSNATVSYDSSTKKLRVTDKTNTSLAKEIEITTTEISVGTLTITPNYGTGLSGTRVGQKTTLSVNYTAKAGGTVSYEWYFDETKKSNSNSATYDCSEIAAGTYSVTVKVYESGVLAVTSEAFSLTVNADTYTVSDYSSYSNKMTPGQSQTLSIRIKNNGTPVEYPEYTVVWTSSNTQVAKFNNATAKEGVLVAQNKTGETTVTAKVTYLNKEYNVSFGKIQVDAADATLNDLKNGSYDYLSDSELKSIVANAINKVSSSTVRSSDISTIKVSSYPAHVTLYKNSKSSSNKLSGSSLDLTTIDDLYYEADAGYIGKDELVLDVKLTEVGSGTITVTLYIPVVAESEIKETVTGTSTSSAVTFTNEAYASLYYTYSKTTDFSGYYTGRRVDGWTLASKNDPITVAANKFDSDGKVTLYVVGLDKDGVASTGTIEVSQKSYTIEYNVVAGESVTFDQDDFEDLFKEYAEDNGDQTTRKTQDYPYVEYSHVELTSSALPATKTEGDLYYGSTALTSKNIKNEEFDDMDKMSFTAISKIKKDTVTIPVTLVGKTYTSASSKGKDVSYNVSVVINVVKEDIKYTVGVNDSVTFDAKDFADYLNDYQTSYKKSTLDYVEFSLGRNSIVGYTSGALYQSYSTYYAGELAESSDKFYYEPSKKQLDLDDVTYVTTKWAEAGKTVYIPFTVYGTKNEKAEGTVAIEIKNAMNFTDVVQGRDYFYDSVQWAVNNEITKGTTTTTFSPTLGCTRAQIVTFLWRAAGSPEPTSSKNPFKDVNSVTHADYYKAILWAVSKGITDGTTATTFSPDATCTRAQIVTFLYRYANSPATSGSLSFKDVSKTTHSAYYNAILWAVNKNITTGNGNNTFAPEQTCNRAEAVTFLYRYFN